MNTEHKKDDDALNAMLNTWQVPAPSPWLATRATQGLLQDARARGLVWPFSLPKLAGMATAAVLMGGLLGANLPPINNMATDVARDDTALDMPAATEVADTVDVSEIVTADAETLEGLW